MEFFCDNKRHLICIPYSVENLHIMAQQLSIDKCFFHKQGKNYHPHYDIPLKRRKEIESQCTKISRSELLKIIKHHIK
jgi:hypothetical protein